MKKLVLKEGKYEYADTTLLDGVLGSVTNVITGLPSTRAQSVMFGTAMFATGVGVSALVFARNKKKYAWFDSLANNSKNV